MESQCEGLETSLGEGIRALRIASRLTQVALADKANVSLGALKNLENGRGSSTSTLVRVVHALGRDDWLESLAPPPTAFNPLDLLASHRKPTNRSPRRVRRRAAP